MPKFHNLRKVIRPRDLPQATGLSRTTCYRLEKDPSSGFPKKIRLSAGAVGFFLDELEVWLESRQTSAHEVSHIALEVGAVDTKRGRKGGNNGND